MRTVAATLDSSATVRVPVVHADLCTARVLVMDRLSGDSLTTAEPLLAALGESGRRQAAVTLLATVLRQILDDGVFHADLHPGNVLVDDGGAIGLLDFGTVGRLDTTTRAALGRLLLALHSGYSLAACDALLELLERPDQVDERQLERALGQVMVRHLSTGPTMGGRALTALFQLVTSHGLGIPPDIAAVFRALATLEGTLLLVSPGFDVGAEARDIGRQRGSSALTPGELRHFAEEELALLNPLLRRLPRRVDRIADAVEHGRLSANVRLFADPSDRHWITTMVHQLTLTALGAAAGADGGVDARARRRAGDHRIGRALPGPRGRPLRREHRTGPAGADRRVPRCTE